MDSISSFTSDTDSVGVVEALRRADEAWEGTDLQGALRWVERAVAIAAGEGQEQRALELARYALDVDREVKRRSGMPDRSDPAWQEARRLQSSLIDVRDSWLDPVELDEEHAEGVEFHDDSGVMDGQDLVRPPAITLNDEDLITVDDTPATERVYDSWRATLPDSQADARARNMLLSVMDTATSWSDEAPTLPHQRDKQAVEPIGERATVRPALGSLNELTLLTELERAGAPGTRPPSIAPTIRLRDATEQDLEDLCAVVRDAPIFEDLSEDKVIELAATGTMIRLAGQHALREFDAAIVVDGAASVMQSIGGEALHADVGDAICFDVSIPGIERPTVLAATAASVAIAWTRDTIDAVLSVCPWILASLRARADEIATLAAIPLRQVSRRMGTSFRTNLLSASRIVALSPGTVLFESGMEVHSLIITGVGEVELVSDDGTVETVDPGTLVFAKELVVGAAASKQARVGRRGATVLHTEAVELARFIPHVPLLHRALSRVD